MQNYLSNCQYSLDDRFEPLLLLSMPPVRALWLHPLQPKHLPAVVELDQRCLGGLWTEAGYRREMESPNSDLLVLEAQLPDVPRRQLVGLACLWAILEEGHITLLGIDPPWQRQGLGQLLLWQLLQRARQRGLEWATLEVRCSNQAALSLYHKLGFQAVGERKRYYVDGENALILWCKGLQSDRFRVQLDDLYMQCCDRLKQFHWELLTSKNELVGDSPLG